MKGTFISADFAQDSSGSLKFLEINTDTTLGGKLPEGDGFWNNLIQLISGSSLTGENITEFHVVYKKQIHGNLVSVLSSSLAESASHLNITTYTEYIEELDTIYPTAIEDANYKFILRLAYDENAILDSTYCKDSVEGLMLFKENNDLDSCIPFLYSGSLGYNNNLTDTINSLQFPDIARKSINPGSSVRFGKISNYLSGSTYVSSSEYDTNRINNLVTYFTGSEYVDSSYMMNYIYPSESIEDGAVSSIRSYHVVYGSSLTSVDLGVYRQYSPFSLPSIDSIETQLNTTQSYLEYGVESTFVYSTSNIKENTFGSKQEGLYEIDSFVSASGELIAGSDILNITQNSGSVLLKSKYIPGLPDAEKPSEYLLWNHSGNTLPSGTIESASFVQTIREKPMSKNCLFKVTLDGHVSSSYFGSDTNILVYNSGSDTIQFTPVSKIDTVNDDFYVFDGDDNLKRITNNEILAFNKNTGSFWVVDTEELDVVYTSLGDDLNSSFIKFHNFGWYPGYGCFPAGTKISLANGDIKNIEDMVVGDSVITFNEETGELEEGNVLSIKTPIHNDIVRYILSDGTEIESTHDHPYYVNGLTIASYNPDKTNKLYNIPTQVVQINLNDTLTKLDKSTPKLTSIEVVNTDAIQTYVIEVDRNFNYFANEILVHNKPSESPGFN
jgi:hypothetical protein